MFTMPETEREHNNASSFELFFERWLSNQEQYLNRLLRLIEENDDEDKIKEVIGQVMAHYNQYYEAKARVASEHVFLVFTPPWFSSFERAYLWIGGFRPGLAFRLVSSNVLDLTEEQSQRIKDLMEEIKEDEKELSEELARIQEGVAFPSMVELARRMGRPRNGEASNMDSAMERLRASMENLVECADLLRRKTIIKLMETMTPAQGVRFLAAAAQLQLRLRRWGMQRDAQMRA